LAHHAAQGTTRLTVQETFPLTQAPEAFAAFTGGTLGKIVITVA
jgi:NADPH:quinone reductase-like Zn-dependent oxidoreductase